MKNNRKLLQLLILLAIASLALTTGLARTESHNFTVSSAFGARDEFSFEVTTAGTISVQASWSGSATNLALILNGPGQTNYYQRLDGPSPLVVTQQVTSQILARGTTWKASIVNFNGSGTAFGAFRIDYPVTEPPPVQQGQQQGQQNFNIGSAFGDRDVFSFEVTTTGTIQVQAAWTGGARNLALVLNGPGQTGYYQRLDGPSPLVVTQQVTSQILSTGTSWQASIVNLSGAGAAAGTFLIRYPIVETITPASGQSTPQQKQQSFNVGSSFGDRDVFEFQVTTAGTIKVQASWTGGARNLALVLNGPGQTGYYQRLDGPSPLVVTQQVTSQILAKGIAWQASIVNLSGAGSAAGNFVVDFPVVVAPKAGRQSFDFQLSRGFGDSAQYSFEVAATGLIDLQATWTGSASSLTLLLNGPGQTNAYKNISGSSPLAVTQEVTKQTLAKGTTWRVIIVNNGFVGNAQGTIRIDYPVIQPAVDSSTHYNIVDRLSITDIEKTRNKAIITVAYTLNTNHASSVYLGAAVMKGTTQAKGFGFKPVPISQGAGTAKVEISTTSTQPTTTDKVTIYLYEGGKSPFAQYTQAITLDWSKITVGR